MWLQMMLEHHTGAVGMAQTEIADGEDADAVAMAQDIADSQSAEITRWNSCSRTCPRSRSRAAAGALGTRPPRPLASSHPVVPGDPDWLRHTPRWYTG